MGKYVDQKDVYIYNKNVCQLTTYPLEYLVSSPPRYSEVQAVGIASRDAERLPAGSTSRFVHPRRPATVDLLEIVTAEDEVREVRSAVCPSGLLHGY